MSAIRILVVEDETIVGLDLKDRLVEMGYEVAGLVESGEAAVERVAADRPELVLMDIRLKGEIDGIAAAETIRRRWQVPVIYLTAFSEDQTLQRAKLTEPVGYIIKPFEDREIQSAIEMGLYKHQAEQRLRQSERRYATTLTSIGDGVIATDCDGRVTFLNPAAEKLTGWSLAEASGRLLSEVFRIADERSGERREDPVARVLREGRAVGLTNDTNLIGRGGDVIPIDDCASPILDDAGRISGTVLVFQDISERRKAEADRERLQAQLLEAQKLESVARLAGGVAHDFNNMLTAILGHTELAMMHADLPGPVRVDLELVWNAAERSAELTRQLLAFARKQIIAPRVLDLNETVAGLLKMLLRLIGENIELVWRPSVRLWRVCADPSQIDQVLVNICVNARDAIGSVGAVTIETRNVVVDAAFRSRHPDASPAGEYALLTVSDTGCGMDDAVLGQLFEPFFTTKEIGKGTGLGLASVHGIVRQNNGFIDVESTPGAGTTFKVYWPRCGESVAEPAAAERSELPRGGGELVLLVEDESAVLQLGRTMLETLGYRVVTANSPSEALRYAGDHSAEIDLLITDVVMPQMNGRDLAQQLLRLRPGLRTLFTSGYTTDIVAEHGVLEDGARFLQKPFSLGALARAVRKILDDGLPSRSEG